MNVDDTGLITRDQLLPVFGDDTEHVFSNCTLSSKQGISWSDFKVACSPAIVSDKETFGHLELQDENLTPQQILEIYL